MSDLHLVTGYKGTAHVGSSDAGSLNAALWGGQNYVLDRGAEFGIQVITNNQVRILDGDLLLQGRHIRLEPNSYTDLSIDNGSQGYNRNDLVVVRYSRSSETGVETAAFTVIKGTPSTGTAQDPAITEGDILNDDDPVADFPLYRIPLAGINVGTPVQLFSVIGSFGGHVSARNNPHGVTAAQAGAAPAVHDHDSRYYTEAEMDTKLAEKSATSHTHDDRYYTETEIDSQMIGKAAASHTHDDRYYTEAEVNSLLSAKSDTGHTHTSLQMSALVMTGNMNAKGIILTEGVDYGTSFPASAPVGKLFFKRV